MANRGTRLLSTQRDIAKVLVVGTDLMIQKEISNERFTANLIGWRTGDIIILDGPGQALLSGSFHRGNRLTMRFIHMGRIYGFGCKVITPLKDPILLVLSFPSTVEEVGLTSETRQKLGVPILVTPHDFFDKPGKPEDARPAELGDISMGGCQLRLERTSRNVDDMVKDRLVKLDLPLPGHNEEVELVAQVRNVRLALDEVVCGLAFVEGQETSRDRAVLALAPGLQATETAAPQDKPEAAPEVKEAAAQLPPSTVEPRRGSVTLDEVTPGYVKDLLGLRDLAGSLVAVNKAREMVRAVVEKVGEDRVRQRRDFYLKFLKNIEGLDISISAASAEEGH